MQKYIIFKNKKAGQDGRKYEAFVKRMVTAEDSDYYYIGKDRFAKSDSDIMDVERVKRESFKDKNWE